MQEDWKRPLARYGNLSDRANGRFTMTSRAQALVRLGATRQEVEEVLGMAVYVGGPSLMYAADAISAFEQFQAQLNVGP